MQQLGLYLKPMTKMSSTLIVAAAASTLATAALAYHAPAIERHARNGASMGPQKAELLAPSLTLPTLLPR